MEKLTLSNLHKVDGGSIALAVDQGLAEIYKDCLDRDNMRKPRELSLKLKFTPDPGESGGGLDRVLIGFEIGSKIPGKSTVITAKNVPRMNGFAFHDDTNNTGFLPEQRTFPDSDDE